jgi:hypothetical protein
MSLCKLVSTVISVLSVVGVADAATIASWTFETSVPSTAGPLSPEVGAGTATGVHAGAAAFSNPSGNGSAESWNSNTWAVGDYYQFQVSTLGKSGIAFLWDQTRSSAGPGQPNPSAANFRVQYSTDGTNFTDALDYNVPVVTWGAVPDASTMFSQNLSAVSALNNQSAVYFRLTAIQAAQNTGGQSRVDNVTVTAIPEPTTVLGLAAGTLVLLAVRHRRFRRPA